MTVPFSLIGRHFSEWGNTDLSRMPYLIGKNFVQGVNIDLDGSVTANGPERDTLPQFNRYHHTVALWFKVDRIPAPQSPFPIPFQREVFPFFSTSAISGLDNIGYGAWVQGSANPALVRFMTLINRVGGDGTGALTAQYALQVDKWYFVGHTFIDGAGGPRIYIGDEDNDPVEITPYFSRANGSGLIGGVNPGMKANGNWVDRWYFGPILVGAYTLQVPTNGPGQQYGHFGATNTRFFTMKGSLAHMSLYDGELSTSQLATLRTSIPINRGVLPGFPSLLADWWMDETVAAGTVIDYSGNGHDLLVVNGAHNVSDAPSGYPGGLVGYPAGIGPGGAT